MRLQKQILCLVGSVAQEQDWRNYTEQLTKLGYVVFEAGSYDKKAPADVWNLITQVHRKKIELSDVILYIRKPDGSVGAHTKDDMDYAVLRSKQIWDVKKWLEK